MLATAASIRTSPGGEPRICRTLEGPHTTSATVPRMSSVPFRFLAMRISERYVDAPAIKIVLNPL